MSKVIMELACYKVSVVICTMNRHRWVNGLLSSLAEQSLKPDQVVIVDASSEENGYNAPPGLNLQILKSERPLTLQRNVGIDASTGDIMVFLDDDVSLEKDYLAEVVNVFANDINKEIGGVGGYIINQWGLTSPKVPWSIQIAKYLGIYDGNFKTGTVSPSGIFDELNTLQPFSGIKFVDFLPGCCMAYRREVFRKYRPVTKITGYGGEDKAFSFLVAKEWKLCICGDAKLKHFSTDGGARPSQFIGYKTTVWNTLYIQKNIRDLRQGLLRLRTYFMYQGIYLLLLGILLYLFPSKRKKSCDRIVSGLGYLIGAFSAC